MGGDGLVPGSARLHLIDGLPLLRPDEQVFEAMIKGWRNQQVARNLSLGVRQRPGTHGRAFTRHADAMPGSGRRSTSTNGQPICGLCTAASAPPCQLPRFCTAVLRLPDQPSLRLERRVPAVLRHSPGPGGLQLECCNACWRSRGRAGTTGLHPARAGSVLRSCRRGGLARSRQGPQGLAVGLPGRRLVQGRVRLRAAPQ